ncbi:MAG: hypothetical protein EPO51_04325 [Phenylobacterium sp.]|uniref:hypothetical protein n=1 Tax=Phenylobacterium sp. TaxID=1871053 RepID=UPI0011F8CEE0|nr:hypothetical protein [Phenylobacterium sp.]TAJ73710.1 MAG: hypothetical protein EPO51_04325 [Phenylobacterium sp.]
MSKIEVHDPSSQGQGGDKPDGDPGKKDVTVKIDGQMRSIRRGSYTTEELKVELSVDPGRELNVVVDGVFEPLEPGKRINVKEGMEFISQQPGGGAS